MSPPPDADLQERFPELRPIRSKPIVGLWNGFGTYLLGRSRHDEATGSHCTNQVLSVLFIPVFVLRSLRVIQRGRDSLILGREPISAIARAWNMAMLAAIVAGCGWVGWTAYTQSAGYRSSQHIAKVETQLEAGDYLPAMESARQGARTWHFRREAFREQIARAFQGFLDQTADEPDRLFDALGQLDTLVDAHLAPFDQPAWRTRQLAFVARWEPDHPRAALGMFERHHPAKAPDQEDVHAERRLQLLDQAFAAHPDDPRLRDRWVLHLEAQGDVPAIRALLDPVADELGSRESARVLGQILAGEGDFERAYRLLWPYADERLKRYHDLEQRYIRRWDAVEQETLAELNQGRASQAWYRRYDAASESDQAAMVEEYLNRKLDQDQRLSQLREDYGRVAAIVPLAFDLGIVSLYHARNLEGAEREQAFARSEEAFLAIRGAMGADAEYQTYLGQVYIWMGRHDEGMALFDQVLQADRSPSTLIMLANTLREVGATSTARAYAEEAYEAAGTDSDLRSQAATARSLLGTDAADSLAWRQKAGGEDQASKASLAYLRGITAMEEGDDAAAEQHFRAAFEGYAALPETAETLNNAALAANGLFQLTGSVDDFRRGVALQREAVRLSGEHSVVISNTIDALFTLSMLELLDEQFDFAAIKADPGFDLLRYCYSNAGQREAQIDRLRASSSFTEMETLVRRLALLAPSDLNARSLQVDLPIGIKNYAAAEAALAEIAGVTLDREAMENELQAWYQDSTATSRYSEYQATAQWFAERLGGVEPGTADHAWLTGNRLAAHMSMAYIAGSQDMSGFRHRAETLAKTWPCVATSALVREAMILECLAVAEAAAGPLGPLDDLRPLLNAGDQLELVILTSSEAKSALAAHQAYADLQTHMAQDDQDFSEYTSVFRWSLARSMGEDVSALETRLKQDPAFRIGVRRAELLGYADPGTVLLGARYRLLTEGPEAANAHLGAATAIDPRLAALRVD